MKNEPRCFLPFSFKPCSFFPLEIISYIALPVGKILANFTTYSLVQIWVHRVYVLISGKNPIIKVLYHSLNGRSGNFLSLACACWWWQQKASWPKFDYKVVSILTETFFLGKHFGRIFTLKVSLNVNIHFRRKSIKLTGISNFVGRKNISSKKVLEA